MKKKPKKVQCSWQKAKKVDFLLYWTPKILTTQRFSTKRPLRISTKVVGIYAFCYPLCLAFRSLNSCISLFFCTTEATIYFMDIAGFTSWSSARGPPEFFMLLESLYGALIKLHSNMASSRSRHVVIRILPSVDFQSQESDMQPRLLGLRGTRWGLIFRKSSSDSK